METLRALYRIGTGPSSSHTLAPYNAALEFRTAHPNALRYRATLWGSLAATGKGHRTDAAIARALDPLEIVWHPEDSLPLHPNGMRFEAFDGAREEPIGVWEGYSTGGGAYVSAEDLAQGKSSTDPAVYEFTKMSEILAVCRRRGCGLFELVFEREDADFGDYLREVWQVMQDSVRRGLKGEGALPGPLGLARKASSHYRKSQMQAGALKRTGRLTAYALAVSEENAAGSVVVTAPSCGASGVVPAVLRYMKETTHAEDRAIINAMATAGVFGNIVKRNASISGAVVGCQGEVGTACAMAAAAAAQLFGATVGQIEYAAEMALEHHLGLTCDPVLGLVQIPCIERNAMAATRALTSAEYALLSDGIHHVSFDAVVSAMNRTGHDIPRIYRETSLGGLAVTYDEEPGDSER